MQIKPPPSYFLEKEFIQRKDSELKKVGKVFGVKAGNQAYSLSFMDDLFLPKIFQTEYAHVCYLKLPS